MKRLLAILLVLWPAIGLAQTTTTYRGVTVREPAPTAEAGLAWQNNFKALADRLGNHIEAAADPTPNDDEANTGGNGAVMDRATWLNTTDRTLWYCLDASAGAAEWVQVSGDSVDWSNVAITGGTIDGAAGTFTSLAIGAYTIAGPTISSSGVVDMRGTYVNLYGYNTLRFRDRNAAGAVRATLDFATGYMTANGLTLPADDQYLMLGLAGTNTLHTDGVSGDLVMTAPSGVRIGSDLAVEQTSDSAGLMVTGWDDKDGVDGKFFVDANGVVRLTGTSHMNITPGQSAVMYMHSTATTGSTRFFSSTGANPKIMLYGMDGVDRRSAEIYVNSSGQLQIGAPIGEWLRLYANGSSANGIHIDTTGDVFLGHDDQYLKLGVAGTNTLHTESGGDLVITAGELEIVAPNVTLTGALEFAPSATETPTSNGGLVFEATSNTSVTVKLKGSDGVVRSATLTLSP